MTAKRQFEVLTTENCCFVVKSLIVASQTSIARGVVAWEHCGSWYRQTQLEAVVKEYYSFKPILKEDRKYAPFIQTMDSVILKDGIDEVCERVYGERTK